MFHGILVATILGSSMAFIDSSIVNVLLPRIQEQFGQTLSSAVWVVQSYGLFLSTFLLLGGALGDHYGRRRIFKAGLLIFLVGSTGCALSGDFPMLLASRALQGLGAALLTPESLAILNATIPERERSRAIGIWSAFSSISGAIGPPLGGWLADTWGWRSAFLVNLPLGALAFLIATRFIPKDCAETGSAHLDLLGTLASTLCIGALILGLTQKSVFLSVLGLVFLAMFLVIEHRNTNPLLPLSVFRSRTFSLTNLLTVVLYAGLGGSFFYLPLHFISIAQYSAAKAGLAILPFVLILFTLSPVTGVLLPRCGARILLTLGPLTTAIGFFLVATLPQAHSSYWGSYLPGLITAGLGLSLTVTPLTTTVLGALGTKRSGLASGSNNVAARIAGLIGVAATTWGGSLIYESTLERLGSRKEIFERAMAMGPFGSHLQISDLSEVEHVARSIATTAGLETLHGIMIAIAILCFIAALIGTRIDPP